MSDYVPEYLSPELLKDIDPILLRPTAPEPFSVRSFLGNLFATSCANVPKSEMATGGDVSHWQGEMDWNKYFDNGMQFTVIRAMINGIPDDQFDRNARILTEQNRLFLVYGATGYPTLSNSIPNARALASIVKGVPYLGIWLDSELAGNLNPYQMAAWNSDFLGELSVLLPKSVLEIYTRQTFWDSSVQAGNWSKYPLAAARYNTSLTCPWSDGLYKFRDWSDWRYWQDSQWWDGKLYGAKSTYIDHDYFNGTLDDFKRAYNTETIPPEPEPDMWKFKVITSELNYRSEPIVTSSTWRGVFKKDYVIDAIRTVNPAYNDFWLEFKLDGNTYYSALTYRGTQYCKQV